MCVSIGIIWDQATKTGSYQISMKCEMGWNILIEPKNSELFFLVQNIKVSGKYVPEPNLSSKMISANVVPITASKINEYFIVCVFLYQSVMK